MIGSEGRGRFMGIPPRALQVRSANSLFQRRVRHRHLLQLWKKHVKLRHFFHAGTLSSLPVTDVCCQTTKYDAGSRNAPGGRLYLHAPPVRANLVPLIPAEGWKHLCEVFIARLTQRVPLARLTMGGV